MADHEVFLTGFSRPAHPQFFSLPATGVNPLRGFIRPALRVTRTRARHDIETTLPLKLMQPNSEAVGPMKPLQGPTPIAGEH
jgi:hypothetical protein